MHRRQSVARPQHNLTPAQKSRPDRYDLCPECGNVFKCIQAKLCRKCRIKSRRTVVTQKAVYIDGRPCRWIGLTRGQKTIVSEHRYENLCRHDWEAYYDKKMDKYYAIKQISSGKALRMHREIAGHDSPHVDHANGNTLDNRDENLRPCTASQNLSNRGKCKTNQKSSQYKGVIFRPYIKGDKPWKARIGFQNTLIHIGTFRTAKEAAMAYDSKAIELFGEFAHTNFPINNRR